MPLKMKTRRNKNPQTKLLEAVYGSWPPTQEQIERVQEQLYEKQAESVSPEEFKKVWGVSIEEHSQKMMLWTGWLQSIQQWRDNNSQLPRYKLTGKPKIFSMWEVIDMVQYFYKQGVEDGQNGTTEYKRLHHINKSQPN